MDEIWNKRREKLEATIIEAALALFEHMGSAAGATLTLPNGNRLEVYERLGPGKTGSFSGLTEKLEASGFIGVDKGSPDGDCTVRGHREPDGTITIDSVEYSQAGAPEAIATGPKLPSRFQLHDTVRAQGVRGTVSAVTFMLVDGMGKVAYDVECGGAILHRVLSDDVSPARPEHLKPVPSAPDPEG